MAIAVSCVCGRQFRAKDDHAGRRTKCPACAAELVISGERLPDHDVFISYSSKDKLIADAVCGRLEEKRIRCWIAPRDVRPGMEWSSAIIDAIADSTVLVLLFTGNANESPQVLREIERAVNKGVAVLPLRLERTELSKSMEYFISASHWLDAIAPPLEQHLDVLAATIKSILNRRKAEPASGAGPAALSPLVPPEAAGQSTRWRWAFTGTALLLVAAGIVVWSMSRGGWRSQGDAVRTASTTAPAPQPPTTAGAGVVNLFPLIDLANDTMVGRWRIDEGCLISDGSGFARVRIRYHPPPEYDFRIEFARIAGQNDVAQMFEVDGHRCVWQMSGGGGREWTFDSVGGQKIFAKKHPPLTNGQRHTSLVQVRRDGIRAYFDGQLVDQVQARPSDLSIPVRWALLGRGGLGLGSCDTPTVFYSAQVTEIPNKQPAGK